MSSAGLTSNQMHVHNIKETAAIIVATLNVTCNGANLAAAAWCLVLLYQDVGAPLHEQRPKHPTPLYTKGPLERARASPWKSHICARIVVGMDGDGDLPPRQR